MTGEPMKEAAQIAVQLVGAGELRLNEAKPIPAPGPTQILAKSEAVGLCFSDMKLLHQFDGHVRKSAIASGISAEALSEMPHYVPGGLPTVPGHEVAVRVLATGAQVKHAKPGDRFIVQADYRTLKTAGSNAAFGYNFEGGLQEYVLFDERVVGDPDQEEGYLIRVPEDRPAAQLALVEPWACVENSYVTPDRQSPKPGGRLLAASAAPPDGDEAFDDIICRSTDAAVIEALAGRLAKGGFLAVLRQGGRIGSKVTLDVGRLHYAGHRYVGSANDDVEDAYGMMPASGEIRPRDRVLVVGAGGPMGQMHVIRTLLGFPEAEVVASDTSAERLAALDRKAAALGGRYRSVLASSLGPEEAFDYIALMAPVPALVEDAIQRARPGGIVNVFAGIPAGTLHPIDLDAVIDKRLYVFGTSGSEPRDMRIVLQKVLDGRLDTCLSVAAVSGMAGALDGLRSVEERTLDGKIVVYPELHGLPLTPLEALADRYPSAASKMKNGQWTREAEEELLRVARG